MQLSEFNQASPAAILALLKQCVHIERWATELESKRPFQTVDDVLAAAKVQTDTWSWAEIHRALATHPRIGEKQAKQTLTDKEENFSKAEQAAVSKDQTTQDALLAGNLAYEAQFDFIFLIRAAGRNSQQILTALHERLKHDLDTEKMIVKQELSEIALLRLARELQA